MTDTPATLADPHGAGTEVSCRLPRRRTARRAVVLTVLIVALVACSEVASTAPYRDVIRAKIVLMAAHGLQNKEIAHRLSLPVQIVTKWRKRFYQEGFPASMSVP